MTTTLYKYNVTEFLSGKPIVTQNDGRKLSYVDFQDGNAGMAEITVYLACTS